MHLHVGAGACSLGPKLGGDLAIALSCQARVYFVGSLGFIAGGLLQGDTSYRAVLPSACRNPGEVSSMLRPIYRVESNEVAIKACSGLLPGVQWHTDEAQSPLRREGLVSNTL